jgi:hypothetical protein
MCTDMKEMKKVSFLFKINFHFVPLPLRTDQIHGLQYKHGREYFEGLLWSLRETVAAGQNKLLMCLYDLNRELHFLENVLLYVVPESCYVSK